MLAGDNSILQKATDAKAQTEVGQEKEVLSIAWNSCMVNKVSNSSGNVYTIKDDGIVEKYEKVEPTAVYAKLYTDGTLILSSTDYTDTTRTIAENGDYGDVSKLNYI